MTTPGLTAGAGLIAFGPFLALFSLLVYQKAQLVIVVTSAAFFFLLSTVVAGLFWNVFRVIGLTGDGSGGPLAAILPAVFAQFSFRCIFVALYHRVEAVIQASLQKQLDQTNGVDGGGSDGSDPDGSDQTRMPAPRRPPQSAHEKYSQEAWTETIKLRLELNDAACGIAAGVGFGGMHVIMLYGTLLASEIMNDVGILYQDSCPGMPSLVLSAIYAFAFSILDIFWMLLTFFGMRRRALYHRGEEAPDNALYRGKIGAWLGDSRMGGNYALLLVLLTHLVAALSTAGGYFDRGCVVTIPMVLFMVMVTAYLFWAGCGRIYMPPAPQLPAGVRIESESVAAEAAAAMAAHRQRRHID